MKKIFVFSLLIIGYLLLGRFVNAEEIKNFDASIKINKDGTIDVVEKIEYDFGQLDRHGIYRTIPYVKTNQAGKRFRLDFNNISVEDKNGRHYRYSQSTEGDDLKLKIGDPDRTVTGVNTYVIKYQISGALTYFSDHDELYWNVTGDDWPVPIVHASAQVKLPEKIKDENIKTVCYTGPTGATDADCYLVDDRPQDIKATRQLNPQEGLTIAVKFPINVVARLEPKEIVDFWQTFIGKLVIWLVGFLALFWYLIFPVKIIYSWWRYGRDPSTRSARSGQVHGEVRAWFDPPKSQSGRELTAGEAGALVDETVDLRDISAMIVDLARRGYLKIEERKKNDFYFVRRSSRPAGGQVDEGGLQPFEKELLNGLFSSSDEIRIKDEELVLTVQEVEKKLYDQLVAEGLFPKNPNSIRIFYSVIGGLALLTFNLPLALIAFTFGRAMPAKTVFGVESANISKSLRNFLTSQQRQLEFLVGKSDLPAGRQVVFEKLLPFAVAFGVERIWAQRFKDIRLAPPEWYSSYDSSRTFNSVIFANSLNSSMSSFRSAATPTRSSSGFSSGFSGGSSGGGGGGGGGGSW